MAESRIQSLPEQEALEQIVETVQTSETGTAPFALVLGSGFSHGLVPTALELVSESLPLWVQSVKDNEPFEALKEKSAVERSASAQQFWRRFVDRNTKRGLILPLDSRTGLPEDYATAYKAAFDPIYTGAVGDPALARKLQRALMRLDKPRLNAAHFLLASLLGVQPGKTRRNDLFKARAAFSRLILTTNFDPFLQTALQAVNRLYFMSDTPELGVSDDIIDDQTDAIHLVYLHGSIHRRSQAATEQDIQALKEKNARILAPVLKRHGVIVLGYSGWDDAIVDALAVCDRFDYRLYWCGRESDPTAKGAFGPRVAEILRKPATVYVKIESAGLFMAQLCAQLVKGLPRLLENPIGQLRELLETIDLRELEELKQSVPTGSKIPQLRDNESSAEAFVRKRNETQQRLEMAEQVFLGLHASPLAVEPALSIPGESEPSGEIDLGATAAVAAESRSKVRLLLSSAQVAARLGNYAESVNLSNQAMELPALDAFDQAEIGLHRALSHYLLGHLDDAIADWTQVITLPGAPVGAVALALNNRGLTWGEKGESEKALADYSRVIDDLPGASVERVAMALYNRGFAWGEKGESEKALADYSRVIDDLPGASVERVAMALNNRGVAWSEKGDTEKTLADYSRVIDDLPDAPVEQVARALYNRGVTWDKKGDTEKALADYSRVIDDLPDAPVEHLVLALNNRGIIWDKKEDREKALADYSRVIDDLPGTQVEQVARALYNRGIAWSAKGDTEKALADYSRIIDDLHGAPEEQVARALYNRGSLWDKKDDMDKALADYSRIIDDLPDAPDDQVARALYNRGLIWGKKGDMDKALADYSRIIDDLPDAPVGQIALTLNNRGIIWAGKGDMDKALADYSRVIDNLPGVPVEQVALALGNRGIVWGKKGDLEKALADFMRVVDDLPGAPIEEVAWALYNRGVAWTGKDDMEKALADYSRLIDHLPGAPVEHVARALNNSAVILEGKGDIEKVMINYSRVIDDLPGAPVEYVAQALNNRGIAWNKKGEWEKALADYSRVIENLVDAPIEQVALALGHRGWVNYTRNNYPDFLVDTQAALNKKPTLDFALFNLGLALLSCRMDEDALSAYRRAGELFPESIESLGLVDLKEAKQTWLIEERAHPMIQLLESLKK